MMHYQLIVVISALLLAFQSDVSAKTLYIPNQACNTVPTAGDLETVLSLNPSGCPSTTKACPGDTVYVCPGTYTDTNNNGAVVRIRAAGSSNAYITVRPSIGAASKPIIDGKNKAENGFEFVDSNNGGKYIKIIGFEIKNTTKIGVSIQDYDGNDYTIPNNLLIEGNYIHDIGVTDITSTGYNVEWGRVGIYAGDGANNIKINGNYLERIGDNRGNRSTCASSGSYCLDHGIYLRGTDKVDITNNILDWSTKSGTNTNPGFPVHLYGDQPISNTKIWHNTIRGTGSSKTDGGAIMIGEYAWGDDKMSNLSIKYNIFHTPYESDTTKRSYLYTYGINNETCDSYHRTGITIDYNITNAQYIGVDTTSSNSIVLCNYYTVGNNNKTVLNTPTLTTTAMQALFMNPAGKDYRLKSTASNFAINKIPLTVGDDTARDYRSDNGDPRPCVANTYKDIGADEYCGTDLTNK